MKKITSMQHTSARQRCDIPKAIRRIGGKIVYLSIFALFVVFCRCNKEDNATRPVDTTATGDQYTITQAISDEAQRNTIAFDGLAFMTGNLGSQSFLPPGKVADYSGFQHLRDNDPTQMGHNTSFVTIIAFNVLHILTTEQINKFVARAQTQIDSINTFAYKRYPMLMAFRRLISGEIPAGTASIDKDALMNYAADLYRLDGDISYDRAELFGQVIGSLTSVQKSQLDALKALNGIGHWDATLSDPLQGLNLSQDVNVAVMTYASEMYAWYSGTVTSDVYFCPERHGTYFGSFYLKDWPAMGNPDYTIDETLTANAGQEFFAILTADQAGKIKGIVDLQRAALIEIVQRRQDIATELRKFLTSSAASQITVRELSERYGQLDGELSYYMATAFSEVYKSLSDEQKQKLINLADSLGYIGPTGAFLYSQPISMPVIANTDFMFR